MLEIGPNLLSLLSSIGVLIFFGFCVWRWSR